MNLSKLIKRPVITEKSVQDAAKSLFTFEVDADANKNNIKVVIEQLYNVDVIAVRTVTRVGKRYRAGKTRQERIGAPTKRARVQLKPGQKIDLFELDEA